MRSKKALLNIVISMTYQIVVAICGLIISRLILVAFGSTYNGVVQSATQFLGMISILTLGIAGATRMELYKTLANADALGTSIIIKTTENYMRKIGVAVVFYALILSVIYPFISHNNLNKFECAIIILIVGIGTFAEYFFGITYRTLLMADQREYIYSTFQILATILNAICVFILIKIDQSIFSVKFWSAIVFAISPIVMSIYVRKNYTIEKNCEADVTALKERKNVAFHSIANIVHQYTDIVLMTLFIDAKYISVYTVYTIATSKVRMLMTVFTTGLEAAFGNMWAKKEYEALKRNFSSYEYIISSFIVVVFSCLFVLIMPFIQLYTDGVNDVNYLNITFAVLMILSEMTYCMRQPYITLVQATGNYKATKKAAGMEAALNVFLSIVLIQVMGISGVVVGTIVANLYRTGHYMVFIYKNILNERRTRFLPKLIYIVLSILMVLLIDNVVFNKYLLVTTWTQWIIKAIIAFGGSTFIAVAFSFLFLRGDLVATISFAKRMILRRR